MSRSFGHTRSGVTHSSRTPSRGLKPAAASVHQSRSSIADSRGQVLNFDVGPRSNVKIQDLTPSGTLPPMLKRSIGALLLCCSLGLGVARAADKPTLALVGGQVIDGYEGPPIHDGVVLIAGERIVAVGRRGEIAVPAGTPVIDTAGMSVLPGLMDMHVHLMILGHADYEYWDKTYMARFRDEIMPIAAKQLLMSGVTTVRDLGAPLEEILHVKRRIEKGEIPGPRLFVSGPFIQHRPYFEYESRSCAGASTGPTTRAPRSRSSSTRASTSSS